MYILAKPNSQPVYPYSFDKLRQDNPNTSFRIQMSDQEYADWSVFPVEPTEPPQVDSLVYRVVEGQPVLDGNKWKQTWSTVAMSAEEITLATRRQQHITNKVSRDYLASTDWYVIRMLETNIAIPQEILERRAAARAAIV